jgi:hypothetical protein
MSGLPLPVVAIVVCTTAGTVAIPRAVNTAGATRSLHRGVLVQDSDTYIYDPAEVPPFGGVPASDGVVVRYGLETTPAWAQDQIWLPVRARIKPESWTRP